MTESTLLLLGVWLNGSLAMIMTALWAHERARLALIAERSRES